MTPISSLTAPSARRSSHAKLFALYRNEAAGDPLEPAPRRPDPGLSEADVQIIRATAVASLDRPRLTRGDIWWDRIQRRWDALMGEWTLPQVPVPVTVSGTSPAKA